MSKKPIDGKRPARPGKVTSGVFSALGGDKRSTLLAVTPVVWSVDCDAPASGSEIEVRRVSGSQASARITRERGTIGVVLDARTRGDAEQLIVDWRQISRCVPLLVFCPEGRIFDGVGASFGVTIAQHTLASVEAARALFVFVGSCERNARSLFERIAAFAAWRGLTSSESDLLYRMAMGVRPKDMHDAQGIGLETKKDRIANLRDKCWNMSLDEILDIALNRLLRA